MVPPCDSDLHFSDGFMLSICHLFIYIFEEIETGHHDAAQGSLDITGLLPHPPLSVTIGMRHNQLRLYILSGEIFTGMTCPV